MIVEVDNMSVTKDQDCIRLHMGPLADGIKKHAEQWIKFYGQKLHECGSQNLTRLQELIAVSRCHRTRLLFFSLLVFVSSYNIILQAASR